MNKLLLNLLLLIFFTPWQIAQADDWSYDLGRQLGERTTHSAWITLKKRRNCDAADDLLRIVSRSAMRLKSYVRRHDFQGRDVVDYAEGWIHGLRSTLNQIALQCTDKCGSLGRVAGEASAIVFCEVADLIDAIPEFVRTQDQPNITCGEPYKISCETSFISAVDLETQCRVYQNPMRLFDRYYQADQGGCCSYNPRPY